MDLPSASRPRPSTLPGVLSLILIMVIHCRSQPILPSLSYPVFMIVPSTTQEPDSPTATIPDDGFEVSQFHSQDELGRVVFGFHGPDQSRMEARSLDGSVRGSYSYIDPHGHIVKMQYWDDGTGFHIAGNALPGDGRPAYTPEVEAAREQHLKIYKQTLAAAQHLLQQSDDSSYSDSPDHDSAQDLNQYEDAPQIDKEHQDNSLYEDDKESISLENPELLGNHNIYKEDEKKEENEPGKEEVEGEVDLGEDVVPDEDLEVEGYENDQPEVDNDKFTEEENDKTKEINDSYNHDQIIIRLKHLTGYYQNEENEQQDVSKDGRESIERNDNQNGDVYIHRLKHLVDYNQNEENDQQDVSKDERENIERNNNDSGDVYIHRLMHLMGFNQNEENDQQDVSKDERKSIERNNNHSGDEHIQNHQTEVDEDEHVKEESDEVEKSRQYSDEDTSHEKYRDVSEGNDSLDYQEEAIIKNESNENSEENNSEADISYDPETSENRNSEMKLVVQPLAQPETQRIRDKEAEKRDSNTEVEKWPAKKRGFFYHFQHTIPKPTERIEESVEKGMKSADGIEMPPSAIHDPQAVPYSFFN